MCITLTGERESGTIDIRGDYAGNDCGQMFCDGHINLCGTYKSVKFKVVEGKESFWVTV